MLTDALKQIKIGLILLVLFTVFTGLLYPAVVTGIAQLFFPWQANGSLVKRENKIIGSVLIGQSFDSPNYFSSRPSATAPYPYNAAASSGSNMGPSNPVFLETVKDRVNHFKQFNPKNNSLIPVDLVTASASGLDPEISPLAAFYQVPRIAQARHISEKEIETLINGLIKNRTLGILGEPRVNVLELNIALDNLRSAHGRAPSKS
jgi:K+-transporting ATPase ATPase C chain